MSQPFSPFAYRLFLVALALVLVLTMVLPHGTDVLWINGHHSEFFDYFFKMITNLGNGIIFLPILIITLFIGYRYALMAFAASVTHGILIFIFKRLVFPDASRPIGVLDHNLLHFVSGVNVHSSHSFPSGHTATAFCAAMLIALLFKNRLLTVISLIVALLVGYSRVYLLQHFLLDVIAGALIGSLTSLVVWNILSGYKKPDWINGRLDFRPRRKRIPSSSQAS